MTDERRKALEDARRVIHGMIKDSGGCDHDVGICVCEWIELCDRIDGILTEPAVPAYDSEGNDLSDPAAWEQPSVPDAVRGLPEEMRDYALHSATHSSARDALCTFATKLERALAQQGEQVPEGWKLVPVEPTEYQVRKGNENRWSGLSTQAIYRAMLAATPEPDSGEGDQWDPSIYDDEPAGYR